MNYFMQHLPRKNRCMQVVSPQHASFVGSRRHGLNTAAHFETHGLCLIGSGSNASTTVSQSMLSAADSCFNPWDVSSSCPCAWPDIVPLQAPPQWLPDIISWCQSQVNACDQTT